MALQLVNVLRDEAEDLAIGRRYLPTPERAAWLRSAHEGLRCGLRYCLALEGRRLRIASALPALIGVRTLTRLETAGARGSAERVKVPRGEVRGLLARLAISMAGRARIQREFDTALVDNRPR
jgi:farnesyl-diphosphate farnesyltransferase